MRRTHRFFEEDNIQTKDLVISVPSYYSNVERQSVLDACDIAGLKCIRLINEGTAVCLNYGFFRKADLTEKDGRTVVFVDFGHSKLTVTIATFWQGKMKVLCHHSDRNLGGRNIDDLLVDKLGEEFAKKHGMDPRKNIRTRLRMLDIIEK
jgi:molecular chaperone DnaK (HSP70)